MTPVEKAKAAEIEQDWHEAARWYTEACRQEPDFDRAADYLMLAAISLRNMQRAKP